MNWGWPIWTIKPGFHSRAEALGDIDQEHLRWARAEVERKGGKRSVNLLICKLEDAREAPAPRSRGSPQRDPKIGSHRGSTQFRDGVQKL